MELIINIWNDPRPNKKLLVLDIDETIAYYNPMELIIERRVTPRSNLKYFLTTIYKYYDIAVWSATPMEFIIEKLTALNMFSNKDYKVLFALDATHMAFVSSIEFEDFPVKPLSLIWENFDEFDDTNTIMVDDQELNFYRNPKNGLKIKSFHSDDQYTDVELIGLTTYLENLAKNSTNFSEEDLADWKSYVPFQHTLF